MSEENKIADQEIEYTLVLDGEDDGGAVIRELERMVPEAAPDVSDATIRIDALPAEPVKPLAPEEIEYTLVLDGEGDGQEINRELERLAPADTIVAKERTISIDAPGEASSTGTLRRTLVRTQMIDRGLQEESPEAKAEEGTAEPPVLTEEDEEIREKINLRKKEKAAKERRARIRLYSFIIIFFALLGFFALSVTNLFTVDSIEVKGNNFYTWEEIINIGHATPGRNIIYDLNKKSIIDYLEQNPYIKSAQVHRKLPSTIVIEVQERVQKCAFKYDDDYLIMDDEGILLKKTRTEPKLTIISGIVVNKIKLGQKVGAKDAAVLNKILDIVRAMGRSDLYFVRIDMGEDDAVKAYIYDNLSVKSRYDVLINNLDNGRLHKIVEKLFEKGIKRGTITFASDGSAAFEPGI